MPFEKGHTLSVGKGRPKGKLNRSTEMAKLSIVRAANKSLDTLAEDIAEIKKENPVKAIELSLKLLEYVIPKLRQVDMEAYMEIDQRIHQITVNVNRADNGIEN